MKASGPSTTAVILSMHTVNVSELKHAGQKNNEMEKEERKDLYIIGYERTQTQKL